MTDSARLTFGRLTTSCRPFEYAASGRGAAWCLRARADRQDESRLPATKVSAS